MVDCVSLSVISLPYLGWKVVVGAAAAAMVGTILVDGGCGGIVTTWKLGRSPSSTAMTDYAAWITVRFS